ncbi:MAG: hypothetical protein DI537_41410 [Stutzerimonas stutzeri]|nr:MAG: hypothetical protein DI537_41410 [Stutzerimonas stutzeri]
MSAVLKSSLDDDMTAEDLIREHRAIRVRVLMGEGMSLADIAVAMGLTEAEVRELMDAGRVL